MKEFQYVLIVLFLLLVLNVNSASSINHVSIEYAKAIDATNNTPPFFKINEPIYILLKLKDNTNQQQSVIYTVVIKDYDADQAIFVNSITVTVPPNQTVESVILWTPLEEKTYSANVNVKSETGEPMFYDMITLQVGKSESLVTLPDSPIGIDNIILSNFRIANVDDVSLKKLSSYQIAYYRFDVTNTGSNDEKFVSSFLQKYEKFDISTKLEDVLEVKANQKTTFTYPLITSFSGNHFIEHTIRTLSDQNPKFSNSFKISVETQNNMVTNEKLSVESGIITVSTNNSFEIPYVLEGAKFLSSKIDPEKKSLILEVLVENQGSIGLSIPTGLVNGFNKITINDIHAPWMLFLQSDKFSVISIPLLPGQNKLEIFADNFNSPPKQKIIESEITGDAQVLITWEKQNGILYYKFQAQKCVGKSVEITVTDDEGMERYRAYLPVRHVDGGVSGDFVLPEKIIPRSWLISANCEGITEKILIEKFYHQVIIPSEISIQECEKTDSCFLPTSLSIYQNDTVIWFNNDDLSHTVESGTPDAPSDLFSFKLPYPFMSSENIYYTFTEGGKYFYHCSIYPWMIGSITVQELKPQHELMPTEIKVVKEKKILPDWIKFNAKMWAEEKISDAEFTLGIEFLIKEKIIVLSEVTKSSEKKVASVPKWLKQNAGWWADGIISEEEFVHGIKYLVENGIIQI